MWRQVRPGIERFLGSPENLLDTGLGFQLAAEVFGVALIGQRELIAQVVEPVVHRRR